MRCEKNTSCTPSRFDLHTFCLLEHGGDLLILLGVPRQWWHKWHKATREMRDFACITSLDHCAALLDRIIMEVWGTPIPISCPHCEPYISLWVSFVIWESFNFHSLCMYICYSWLHEFLVDGDIFIFPYGKITPTDFHMYFSDGFKPPSRFLWKRHVLGETQQFPGHPDAADQWSLQLQRSAAAKTPAAWAVGAAGFEVAFGTRKIVGTHMGVS